MLEKSYFIFNSFSLSQFGIIFYFLATMFMWIENLLCPHVASSWAYQLYVIVLFNFM